MAELEHRLSRKFEGNSAELGEQEEAEEGLGDGLATCGPEVDEDWRLELNRWPAISSRKRTAK